MKRKSLFVVSLMLLPMLLFSACNDENTASFPGTLPGVLPGTSVKITPAESASVTFEHYEDGSGYFSLDKPKGWKVQVGLKGTGDIDLISYAISVSDPNCPEREMYFNLNCVGGVKSQEAHDWYASNYGANSEFAVLPVFPSVDTEGFFRASEPFYGYSGFTVAENLGASVFGGEVLVGKCVSKTSGKKMEGIFSATVDGSFTYYVLQNPFSLFGPQIDAAPVSVYTILMETAPEEEIIDWQPVLDRIVSSISFTDTFIKARNELWRSVMGTTGETSNNTSELSSGIMDSWEKRSATYDVISQKQSDATLGYERVLDTETGNYYRTEIGFGDWYQGERYQVQTDNKAYLSPIEGYIEWK